MSGRAESPWGEPVGAAEGARPRSGSLPKARQGRGGEYGSREPGGRTLDAAGYLDPPEIRVQRQRRLLAAVDIRAEEGAERGAELFEYLVVVLTGEKEVRQFGDPQLPVYLALAFNTGRIGPCPLSTSSTRRPLGCTQTRWDPSASRGGSKLAFRNQRATSAYRWLVPSPDEPPSAPHTPEATMPLGCLQDGVSVWVCRTWSGSSQSNVPSTRS